MSSGGAPEVVEFVKSGSVLKFEKEILNGKAEGIHGKADTHDEPRLPAC